MCGVLSLSLKIAHSVRVLRADSHRVFATVVNSEDYIVPLTPGKAFDKADYYKSPHKYRSVFHEKVRM